MDHAISAWNPRVALLVGFRCPHVGSPSSRLQPLSVSIIIISTIIIIIIIIIIFILIINIIIDFCAVELYQI